MTPQRGMRALLTLCTCLLLVVPTYVVLATIFRDVRSGCAVERHTRCTTGDFAMMAFLIQFCIVWLAAGVRLLRVFWTRVTVDGLHVPTVRGWQTIPWSEVEYAFLARWQLLLGVRGREFPLSLVLERDAIALASFVEAQLPTGVPRKPPVRRPLLARLGLL